MFNYCSNLASSHHRTSLLHISAEKRARKVRFFINNDKFFKVGVLTFHFPPQIAHRNFFFQI